MTKIISLPLSATDARTIRQETDGSVSVAVASLKGKASALTVADTNGDGFLEATEAQARLAQLQSAVDNPPSGFLASIFCGMTSGKERTELNATRNAYNSLLESAREFTALPARPTKKSAQQLQNAAESLSQASAAIEALPGDKYRHSSADSYVRDASSRLGGGGPFSLQGLAAFGHSADAYEKIDASMEQAVTALAGAASLRSQYFQLQSLQSQFQKKAAEVRVYTNMLGGYAETTRGMTKAEALDFVAKATAIVNDALTPAQ